MAITVIKFTGSSKVQGIEAEEMSWHNAKRKIFFKRTSKYTSDVLVGLLNKNGGRISSFRISKKEAEGLLDALNDMLHGEEG